MGQQSRFQTTDRIPNGSKDQLVNSKGVWTLTGRQEFLILGVLTTRSKGEKYLNFIVSSFSAWKSLILVLALLPLQAIAQYGPPPRDQGFAVFYSQGVRIGPGRSLLYNFHVATYLRRARLAGNIMAQGGSGNDIQVLVSRNQRIIYDSGQRRSVVLSIPITEPGEYSLIVSNAFSVLSGKVASGYVNLLYDGIDNERAESDRQNTARRVRAAQQMLDQLYAVLRVNERELGTFQVPYKPTIVVSSNEEVNASASPRTNTIRVNRGTFEVAESYPNNEIDILAGVIAHELAHIFYRHSNGRPTGFNIWDELAGVLPIDRAQEREADLLGGRLACQAGFDPMGLIMYMESLVAKYGNGKVFGSHPQNSERVGYLRQEVAKCSYSGNASHAQRNRSRPKPLADGRVAYPSQEYRTYSKAGLLRVSVPDNWRELEESGASVWFSPDGGYSQISGRTDFAYGVNFGKIQTQKLDLQQATDDLINGLIQNSRNLQRRTGYQQIYLNGRNWWSITLNNINEATGNPESVTIATTHFGNDVLFYTITVCPESECRKYRNIFSNILKSIQLNG